MDTPHTWPRCPEAAAFFARQMDGFRGDNPCVAHLANRLLREAGVRIENLADYWRLPASKELARELAACGLIAAQLDGEEVWEHPQARFPRVRMAPADAPPRLSLAVEDVDHFLDTHEWTPQSRIGLPGNDYQEAVLPLEEGELSVVVREGTRGFAPAAEKQPASALREAQHRLFARSREGSEAEVIAHLCDTMQPIIAAWGAGRAADLFFASERRFYRGRNLAAGWQYERQQRLGIGWANHDHHTYRSSRASFRALMQFFLLLGFEMRERFYAGAEAGWGAQILEHPVSRVVIFADVDMAPEELDIDFAQEALPPRPHLGTIGLWCALHGSSIAQAGMHHLEAEFDFAHVQHNLELAGFGVMPPFTDLPMLKQAFTVPQMWAVDEERLAALETAGQITPEQAEKFRAQGAPGSHLEILQRWEGFKGFNKTGVSSIIRATDARAL